MNEWINKDLNFETKVFKELSKNFESKMISTKMKVDQKKELKIQFSDKTAYSAD